MTNRRPAITLRDGHAAVNVKVYNLNTPDGYTDSDRERAWDFTVEQFWDDATRIAHKRGYTGVFAEGRSGGWCVPYLWSKGNPRHSYYGPYSQGPDVGHPVYPDVATRGGEREKFRAFERDIKRLLADVQAEYTANLEQAKETREEYQ
jgi:hypothetical protein